MRTARQPRFHGNNKQSSFPHSGSAPGKPAHSSGRWRTATIVTATAIIVATALLGGGAIKPPPATASPGQELQWGECENPAHREGGFECATLQVPLDRRGDPADTIGLAVVRHQASGSPEQRIGSLVFNPGGPGGSGLQAILWVWQSLPEAVTERFDVVSWDPRGVGQTELALQHCGSPLPLAPAVGDIDWKAVAERFEGTLGALNRQCQESNATLISHLSTNESVADLDHLRSALGEEQLTYWGMSYGTRIGYAYALAYPENVRAMVLDGSIDPSSTFADLTEGAAGPDQAFGSFLQANPAAGVQLQELLAHLDEATVPLPYGGRLTRWTLLDFIFNTIAQQSSYPMITTFLETAHTAVFGTGEEQPAAAKRLNNMINRIRLALGNGGNAGAVFSAVNCLDYPDRHTTAAAVAMINQQTHLGPYYGGNLATMFALNCAGLELPADPIPVITGHGPEIPVLILGATRDGSTIVQWTARMSRAFPASRTVTYSGGQHVVWGLAGSACVDDVANNYVINLELPAGDVGCSNVATD